MIDVHPSNCKCQDCWAAKGHNPKDFRRSRSCPPGCDCRRHNPTHKPGCSCNQCRGKIKSVDVSVKSGSIRELPKQHRRPARPDVCECGHISAHHDLFGCTLCAKRRTVGKRCSEFRSRAGYSQRVDGSVYEREVSEAGFIKHIDELATCTRCWTVVKLGVAKTLTSVISARAHEQICREHVRAKQENRRPEPGDGSRIGA